MQLFDRKKKKWYHGEVVGYTRRFFTMVRLIFRLSFILFQEEENLRP